jgi:golgi-specific brefeldin A-resistance guanine nucleotide exchange factor 1
MSSSGYLVPPSKDPSQEKLWVETWKRIDRFLPDLRNELALEDTKAPEEAPSAEASKEPVEQEKEGTAAS